MPKEGAPDAAAQAMVDNEPDVEDLIAEQKDDAEISYSVREAFKKTAAALRAAPKETIRIAPDPMNLWRKTYPVQINGVRLDIPVGKRVAVPAPVAILLQNAGIA